MTLYNFYFYFVFTNRWNVELELLTSLKTILFQLTEIERSFETFYFFFLLEVNIVNRTLIFYDNNNNNNKLKQIQTSE